MLLLLLLFDAVVVLAFSLSSFEEDICEGTVIARDLFLFLVLKNFGDDDDLSSLPPGDEAAAAVGDSKGEVTACGGGGGGGVADPCVVVVAMISAL